MSNPLDLIKNGDFVEITDNYSKKNEWFGVCRDLKQAYERVWMNREFKLDTARN